MPCSSDSVHYASSSEVVKEEQSTFSSCEEDEDARISENQQQVELMVENMDKYCSDKDDESINKVEKHSVTVEV